jgi:hypothetical protein
MRSITRTLALGAVLAAGMATAAMAQGVNNTGYDRNWYNGDPQYGTYTYTGNPAYHGYYGYANPYDYYGNNPGYGTSVQRGWGSGGGAAYDRGINRGYWGR